MMTVIALIHFTAF